MPVHLPIPQVLFVSCFVMNLITTREFTCNGLLALKQLKMPWHGTSGRANASGWLNIGMGHMFNAIARPLEDIRDQEKENNRMSQRTTE
eukprot:1160449-Pelagomonas_calceolata.AAC.15